MKSLAPCPTSTLLRCLFKLCLLLFLTTPLRAQSAQAITIGNGYKLYSNLLGEERQYYVHLPASYEQDDFYAQKRYPVIVLLDGDTHFRYAGSMIEFMSAGEVEQIPEMIVVAVLNTNRLRDMTSIIPAGTDPLLGFLEKELMPLIDRQYRTLPYRLLVGHSLAGLFALNCFLEQRAFNAYLIIDPTLGWRDGYILKKAETVLATNASLAARLYVAQADNPFETGSQSGTRGGQFGALKTSLASNHSPQFAYQSAYYGQETHYSVPLPSLRDGLLFVFKPYQFPFQILLSEGSAGIKSHYEQSFRELGFNLLPPGKVINQVGLFLLHNQKQVDEAVDLFKLNVSYYPNSFLAYHSLGEAYAIKGDKPEAIRNYKKALTLKPTDELVGRAILKLTKQ